MKKIDYFLDARIPDGKPLTREEYEEIERKGMKKRLAKLDKFLAKFDEKEDSNG